MKRLSVLGSTGSVGTQTLDVAARFPDRLAVTALAAGRNVDLLVQQAKQFRPERVSVEHAEDAERVRAALSDPAIEVGFGAEGLREVASTPSDLVIGALVGRLGLEPVLAALRAGSDLALANKEVLVTAGALVLAEAERVGARVLPIDSEHAAIHQCLAGHPREAVKKVWLTASGGPFRTSTIEEMESATPEHALAHPNWEMGRKISIDSATLMNKGFEVIEARWLFGLDADEIGVLIHPESLVHSFVEYIDGSWLAQLGIPDMRVPIAYALALPERLPLPDLSPLDLAARGALHFEQPDTRRFPALGLALESLRLGGTAPCMLNAANEVAVDAFLNGRIRFTQIAAAAEEVMDGALVAPGLDLEEIAAADEAARAHACRWLEEHCL